MQVLSLRIPSTRFDGVFMQAKNEVVGLKSRDNSSYPFRDVLLQAQYMWSDQWFHLSSLRRQSTILRWTLALEWFFRDPDEQQNASV